MVGSGRKKGSYLATSNVHVLIAKERNSQHRHTVEPGKSNRISNKSLTFNKLVLDLRCFRGAQHASVTDEEPGFWMSQ